MMTLAERIADDILAECARQTSQCEMMTREDVIAIIERHLADLTSMPDREGQTKDRHGNWIRPEDD